MKKAESIAYIQATVAKFNEALALTGLKITFFEVPLNIKDMTMDLITPAVEYLKELESTAWKAYADVLKLRTPEQWAHYDNFDLQFEEVKILKKKRVEFRVATLKSNRHKLLKPGFGLEYKHDKDTAKKSNQGS